jgi:hypothetical protein
VKYIQLFMPALIQATKDINLRNKYAAERAMKYLLDGGSLQGVNAYVAGAEADAGKFIRDYAKRIIVNLPEDSDAEADRW